MTLLEAARPVYGQRLLPQVLDEYKENDPTRVYASCGTSTADGYAFRDFTVFDIANATNACAWWMRNTIGQSSSFETIAFVGTADLCYPMVCLSSIKCGWVTLLLGTRNSPQQNLSLLRRTECTKILYSANTAQVVQGLQALEPEIKAAELPSFQSFLSIDTPHFPYEKSFSKAENDPILHIHSSGSTGDPKIITMTNGTVAVTDNDRNIPTPEGRKPQNGAQFQFDNGGRFYTCFPPYHLAGLQAYLILPTFYFNATVVIGPQDVPPTGQLMFDVIRYHEKSLKAFYVPPLIVEQWANTDEGMKQSEQLDFILYGGGPLSTTIGNRLSQNTDVCQMYGCAEVGQIQLLVPQRDEWAYMEWNPYEEVDMQPNGDNTFEMVLHQNDKFRLSRSLSHNFPHIKEWRMGDLFSPHPSKPNLWKFYSRVDDIIVLSNSHKVNPIPIESQIGAHQQLSGALLLGSGRPQLTLLLELVEYSDLENARYLVNDIWPSIELVNQTLPAYARISRSRLLIGNPAKPFLRTPKGSVVRNKTIELYAREIASLYENEESQYTGILQNSCLEGNKFEDILAFVRSLMYSVLSNHLLSDTQNLFEAGMDSIKVFEVLETISNNASKYIDASKEFRFSPNMIYQNPTISGLSQQLHSTINDIIPQGSEAEIKDEMNRLIDKYTMDLPQRQFMPSLASPTSKKTVLLTGTTGTLGSQVLRELELNPNIDKIFCFNRSHGLNSSTIQKPRYSSPTSHSDKEDKIENIIVDLSKPHFNLSDEFYQRLLSTVNVIFHLAWRVDFNLNLQSFESNFIYSIRSLVNFSHESPLNARIIFISSTSYGVDRAFVRGDAALLEKILPRQSIDTASNGYGQSKEVAEQILSISSKQSGVPVSIIRVGQIAGHEHADAPMWSKQEWVPSLVMTSKCLCLIPNLKISIDWIPVNIVARVILELAEVSMAINKDTNEATNEGSFLQIYNVIHPQPVPWSCFVESLLRMSPTSKIVTLDEWVENLKSHSNSFQASLEAMPAVKLIPFFEKLQSFDSCPWPYVSTSKSTSMSSTLSGLPIISNELLDKWASI